MKKNNVLLTVLFLLSMIFVSCNGKDGAPGPQGPVGDPGSPGVSYNNPGQDWTYKEGFIRGTAAGTLLNGSPFSYILDFQGNTSVFLNRVEVSSTATNFLIHKNFSGEGTEFESGVLAIQFSVESLADLSTPVLTDLSFTFTKVLDNNQYHFAQYVFNSSNANGVSGTITGLAYNSITGIITGNYTFSAPADFDHGNISITDGTFSSKVSSHVARMAKI